MLSLERFAGVRASIETEEARDEVLEAQGLSLAEWIACEREWLGALATEVAAGRTELAVRYLAAFRAACPVVEPTPAEPSSALVETSPAAPQPASPTTAVAPPLALPTYLANQRDGGGAASPAMGPDRSLDSVMARPPADSARVAPPATIAIRHLPDPDQTLPPASASVRRPALPFAKGLTGASVPSPERWSPADPSGETLPISASHGPVAATPFAQPALEGWTVEKYAAFVGDRRVLGIEKIRLHYGVTDDAVEQRVTAHFNKLLAGDGALRNRWIALVAERARGHRSPDERR